MSKFENQTRSDSNLEKEQSIDQFVDQDDLTKLKHTLNVGYDAIEHRIKSLTELVSLLKDARDMGLKEEEFDRNEINIKDSLKEIQSLELMINSRDQIITLTNNLTPDRNPLLSEKWIAKRVLRIWTNLFLDHLFNFPRFFDLWDIVKMLSLIEGTTICRNDENIVIKLKYDLEILAKDLLIDDHNGDEDRDLVNRIIKESKDKFVDQDDFNQVGILLNQCLTLIENQFVNHDNFDQGEILLNQCLAIMKINRWSEI